MEERVDLGGVVETVLVESQRLCPQVFTGDERHFADIVHSTAQGLALNDGTQFDEVAQLRFVAAEPVIEEAVALPSERISYEATLTKPRFEITERLKAAEALAKDRARDTQLAREVSLRRQPFTARELPGFDAAANPVGDLPDEMAVADRDPTERFRADLASARASRARRACRGLTIRRTHRYRC